MHESNLLSFHYVMVSMPKFYDELKVQQDGGFIAAQLKQAAGGSRFGDVR
jgi:hypothetical protein